MVNYWLSLWTTYGCCRRNANLGIPNEDVLAFAVGENRTVITLNRQDFIRLHKANPERTGIIVYSNYTGRPRMATPISETIATQQLLLGKLIRVVSPAN